jgi:hypothetical protein
MLAKAGLLPAMKVGLLLQSVVREFVAGIVESVERLTAVLAMSLPMPMTSELEQQHHLANPVLLPLDR